MNAGHACCTLRVSGRLVDRNNVGFSSTDRLILPAGSVGVAYDKVGSPPSTRGHCPAHDPARHVCKAGGIKRLAHGECMHGDCMHGDCMPITWNRDAQALSCALSSPLPQPS